MEEHLSDFYQHFRRDHAEVDAAFEGLSSALHKAGALGPRERRLVKLGIAIGANSEGAVRSHVRIEASRRTRRGRVDGRSVTPWIDPGSRRPGRGARPEAGDRARSGRPPRAGRHYGVIGADPTFRLAWRIA